MIYPNKIIRKDDNEVFIHLGEGMYRTEWGNNNGSISETPFEAFDENLFEFIFAEEKVKNIAKTVEEKGFKPKTVTTQHTHRYLLGGKNFLINDMCIYLWLCEVQNWLGDEFNIDVFPVACFIGEDKYRYSYYIVGDNDQDIDADGSESLTYQEALELGIEEALKLISQNKD